MTRTAHPLDRRGRPIPDGSWPGRRAPGRLEGLRRFLNTTNRESTAELLDGPRAARDWLEAEGYRVERRLAPADVALLIDVREALRALAGEPAGRDARPVLEHLAARCPVIVSFTPEPRLVPARTDARAFAGEILGVAHDAMVDGSWPRLKVCQNERCRWFFYDHSRNSVGRWCSTTACGSRLKARAYRTRKKQADA